MKIAMISDYFYPRLGGVENHILNLSKELRKIGHEIVIITNANTGISGVHYIEGFKTYYLTLFTMFSGSVFPTIISSALPVVEILLAERIEVAHGHQCSTLALEGLFHSRILGIPTCFTNHSLVKTETVGGVVTASTFKMTVKNTDRIICVSSATKYNTMDRLGIKENQIKVIPNAVTEEFKPETAENSNGLIVISVVTRLTTRKGSILLAEILPAICAIDERIRIVIAGEGEKKELLEQTVERHRLNRKVTFLGGIDRLKVKDLLNRSHLFLNTSLTDAFCISIIEAAACGLYVVSTNVDGIGEVLPKDMITLVNPTGSEIITGIRSSIPKIPNYNREVSHRRVHSMYRWSDIAEKTDRIYKEITERSIAKKRPKITKRSDILKIVISKIFTKEKESISFPFRFLLVANYVVIFILSFYYEARKRHSIL